jgi:hypothetical protein
MEVRPNFASGGGTGKRARRGRRVAAAERQDRNGSCVLWMEERAAKGPRRGPGFAVLVERSFGMERALFGLRPAP